jgi:hypothetical protein
MSERFRIDPQKYTVVLTSCGRFDLLEDTIASFARHFDFDALTVAEDSGDHAGAEAFRSKFDFVEVLVNDPKLGQMRSIDRLYERIATPYIIHLEDDWRFNATCDLDKIVRVLDANRDLTGVIIANREYAAKYEPFAEKKSFEGIGYKFFELDAHPEWFSYSFNPSVVARRTWIEMGPFSKYKTEAELSKTAKTNGMRYAMVSPALAIHTGDERHVPDPFQPRRAKTFSARLMRSIRKRMRRVSNWLSVRT